MLLQAFVNFFKKEQGHKGTILPLTYKLFSFKGCVFVHGSDGQLLSGM